MCNLFILIFITEEYKNIVYHLQRELTLNKFNIMEKLNKHLFIKLKNFFQYLIIGDKIFSANIHII